MNPRDARLTRHQTLGIAGWREPADHLGRRRVRLGEGEAEARRLTLTDKTGNEKVFRKSVDVPG
jgi:hypothetical protein